MKLEKMKTRIQKQISLIEKNWNLSSNQTVSIDSEPSSNSAIEYRIKGYQKVSYVHSPMKVPLENVPSFASLMNSCRTLSILKEKMEYTLNESDRPLAWRVLLYYLPKQEEFREQILAQKRKEYRVCKAGVEKVLSSGLDKTLAETVRVIDHDVDRTFPSSPLFRRPEVQKIMRNVLLVISQRHPATGYGQGMNDLLAPFVFVFHNETIEADDLEADLFFCFWQFLTLFLNHFMNGFKGVDEAIEVIEKGMRQFCPRLAFHFETEGINIRQFAFRMVYCLLVREFPLSLSPVLIDFYLLDTTSEMLPFLTLALLIRFSSLFLDLKYDKLIVSLQSLPLYQWSETDLRSLLEEAKFMREASNTQKELVFAKSERN